LKHSTVQSIAFCMREMRPRTFQFQTVFREWSSLPGGGDSIPPGPSPSTAYGRVPGRLRPEC